METHIQRLSVDPRPLRETQRHPRRRARTSDFQSALEGRAPREEHDEQPERAAPTPHSAPLANGEPGSLLDVVG